MIPVVPDTATRWRDVEVTLTDRQSAFDSSFSLSSEIHTRVDFLGAPVSLPPFCLFKGETFKYEAQKSAQGIHGREKSGSTRPWRAAAAAEGLDRSERRPVIPPARFWFVSFPVRLSLFVSFPLLS